MNELVRDTSLQVNINHYDFLTYVTPQRWASYYCQMSEVLRSNAKRVLEVGAGTQICASVLRSCGLSVDTLDLDPGLTPTILGSVLDIPVEDASYDLVAAFQVLEHLEYRTFVPALKEMGRVSKGNVVISLPNARTLYPVSVQIPLVGFWKFGIPRPRFMRPPHEFDGEHYWEIEKKGFALSKIKQDIRAAGFSITRSYRVPDNPYHQLFVLKRS